MNSQYLTTTISVTQSPEEVFAAINNVRAWWSEEIEGDTDQLGGEFVFHYKDIHRSTQRVTEFVPARKVVWRVLDGYLKFTQDKAEWTGTEVTFEISRNGKETVLLFTHMGLRPGDECFDVCTGAWNFYVGESLFSLIATGKGKPNLKEVADVAMASA